MAEAYLRHESAQINSPTPPTIFQFDNSDVRVLDQDGDPWFVATDVACILGYTNPHKAIRDHCKGANETFTPSKGGSQLTKIIPERDVYRLIMRSKLPAAERFEEWVVGEVLPQIRKTGSYAVPAPTPATPVDPMTDVLDRLLTITEKLVDIMPARIAAAEAQSVPAIQAPATKPTPRKTKVKGEEYFRVKDVIRIATGGAKLRHAHLVSIGRSMGKFCEQKGYEALMFQNRNLYPKSAVDAWLEAGGRAQIEACVKEGGNA